MSTCVLLIIKTLCEATKQTIFEIFHTLCNGVIMACVVLVTRVRDAHI